MSLTVVQLGGGQGPTGVQVATGQQVEVVTGIRQPLALDDLTDVDTASATAGQVLTLGEDGVWYPETPAAPEQWGDAVAFSYSAPDADSAPNSAVWVELGPELKIYRKAP